MSKYRKKKIIIDIAFWTLFLSLLVGSITFVVLTYRDGKESHDVFSKVWGAILTLLTIVNAPVTFLKIKSSISNYSLERKKEKEMLQKEVAFMMDRKTFLKNKLSKKLNKEVKTQDAIQFYCESKGKKLVGATLYDVLEFLKIEDRETKKEKLFNVLKNYLAFTKEEDINELKRFVNSLI